MKLTFNYGSGLLVFAMVLSTDPSCAQTLQRNPQSSPNVSLDIQNFGARSVGLKIDFDAPPLRNSLPEPSDQGGMAEPSNKLHNLKPGFGAINNKQFSNQSNTRVFGSFGIPYTSSRIVTGASNQTSSSGPNYLSTTYPYRTVGKLFLNGGFCSASLIRRSVIVTAAHCVQNFNGHDKTFGGWLFIPGHYGAVGSAALSLQQPYGHWSPAKVVWPKSWSDGTDTGSGAARNNDLAIMILQKDLKFLGDIIGYTNYGYNNYSFTSSSKTGDLSIAATSTLGYPGLLDSGKIMQRVDGPSFLTTLGNALQIWQGSNFTGGSSGGPWFVNFVAANPALAGGAVQGLQSNIAVVGVTSWGSADPNASKDNYSSRFGQNKEYPNAHYGIYGAGNIASLLDTACNAKISSSSSTTYASAGYCD